MGRRPFADADRMNAALVEALDQRRFEDRRGDPAIIADHHFRSARPRHQCAEAPADRIGIGLAERLADNAPDVRFAQRGQVELVRHSGSLGQMSDRYRMERLQASPAATPLNHWGSARSKVARGVEPGGERRDAAAVGMIARDEPAVRGDDRLAVRARRQSQQIPSLSQLHILREA